jgi:Flp pilus assembly protein protease CpaA
MEAVSIFVILICTVIATVVDIKIKEVPNFISYFLIIFGLGTNLLFSLLTQSIEPFFWSVIGAGVFYGFGAALYYTGVWGGGDAKLLTGFGAVLANFTNIVAWPFLLTIIFNTLLFGAIFGVIGSLGLAMKHKPAFVDESRELLKKFRYAIYILWGTLIIVVWFIYSSFAVTTSALIWSVAVLMFYLIIMLKAVENVCMYRHINPSKLVEGDWLAEDVKINNKLIYKPAKEGISREDIATLIKFEKQNKLKTVSVKDGLPYVPAFLAALIASLLGYDLMFLIFSSIVP